jgi:signal transduction histidine kinase
MIGLQKRLILTYSLFISVSLFILTAGINIFSEKIFENFVRDTIKAKNNEIVTAVSELYNPLENNFDITLLEVIGMLFVHDGYIIDVEGSGDIPVWNARAMDMRHCVNILNEINTRMKKQYGVNSELQNTSYPIKYHDTTVGQVNIATVGPFFYTEAQGQFLSSLNRLLVVTAFIFIVLSVIVSVIFGISIATPINRASEAARNIAVFYASAGNRGELKINIKENYKTRELKELSKSINALARELADGERRQKQLTSDIAHELRTPLACLRGNIEAMIDGVLEATPERLASCHEEIIRLTKLIEDMRILTGLEWESIALNKTDFDIQELLERVAGQFAPAANDKGIEIRLKTESAKVYADYDRIKQVIINLVSNAVKYTDSGHIIISAEHIFDTEKNEKKLVIKIEDTGIGIAKEDLPHIFERFYRTDKSRNRKTGGFGIGLTIAAAIAAAHRWKISAESENGAGSVFTVIAYQLSAS